MVEIPTAKTKVPWQVAPACHALDGFWMDAQQLRSFLRSNRALDIEG
jgi:hypothetical protein